MRMQSAKGMIKSIKVLIKVHHQNFISFHFNFMSKHDMFYRVWDIEIDIA